MTGALLMSASYAGAATFTVSSAVGGAPTGVNYVDFDDLTLPLGSGGGTSDGVIVSMTPNAQVVLGSASGLYAAPFLSNTNGAPFGDLTFSGPDATHYITSGSTGATAGAQVTLTLPGLMKYFGLLWGSVDAYNTLSFYDGNTLIGSVLGTDVTASANGNQGASGTYYVNILSDTFFNKVVATSTQYAFEFDNVAYNTTPGGSGETPVPGALWLFGSVLAGSGLLMRRRRKGTLG